MYSEPRVLNCGDTAVTLELGNSIDKNIFMKIRQISILIEKEKLVWIKEYMPSFRSILIHYDPEKINYQDLVLELKKIIDRSKVIKSINVKKYFVPVVFGKQYGPDLEKVAKLHNIDEKEVVKIFTKKEYLNFFNGFAPGLPNMALPSKLLTPRLKTPRIKIPSGSIGFGGQQACIYPLDSAGGHNLVGRTPLKLFDQNKLLKNNNIVDAIIFKTGDYLKFYSINESEYEIIKKDVDKQKYKIKYKLLEERMI